MYYLYIFYNNIIVIIMYRFGKKYDSNIFLIKTFLKHIITRVIGGSAVQFRAIVGT